MFFRFHLKWDNLQLPFSGLRTPPPKRQCLVSNSLTNNELLLKIPFKAYSSTLHLEKKCKTYVFVCNDSCQLFCIRAKKCFVPLIVEFLFNLISFYYGLGFSRSNQKYS